MMNLINNNAIVVFKNNGMVGIGTNEPTNALDIKRVAGSRWVLV